MAEKKKSPEFIKLKKDFIEIARLYRILLRETKIEYFLLGVLVGFILCAIIRLFL